MAEQRLFGEWVRFLWRESIERRIVISKEERTAVNLPLLLVIIAAVVAPWLAAIGLVIGVVMGYRIGMERVGGEQNSLAGENEGELGPLAPAESTMPAAGSAPLAQSPAGESDLGPLGPTGEDDAGEDLRSQFGSEPDAVLGYGEDTGNVPSEPGSTAEPGQPAGERPAQQ